MRSRSRSIDGFYMSMGNIQSRASLGLNRTYGKIQGSFLNSDKDITTVESLDVNVICTNHEVASHQACVHMTTTNVPSKLRIKGDKKKRKKRKVNAIRAKTNLILSKQELILWIPKHAFDTLWVRFKT